MSDQTSMKRPKPYKGIGMEGRIAVWYAKNTARDMAAYSSLAEKLARQLPSGARVLELAPGPGYLAIELAKRGSFQISGLDISKTFVEMAQKNAEKESVSIDFQVGNASAMPYEDGTFDFIVCRAAFKNFTEPVEAMNEMNRVLKTGGSALIHDLNKDASLDEIKVYVDEMKLGFFDAFITKQTFRFMLIPYAHSKDQLSELAKVSKFGSAKIAESGIALEVTLTK